MFQLRGEAKPRRAKRIFFLRSLTLAALFAGMENSGGGDSGFVVRLAYLGKRPVCPDPYTLSLSGPKLILSPSQNLEDFYRKSGELAKGVTQ